MNRRSVSDSSAAVVPDAAAKVVNTATKIPFDLRSNVEAGFLVIVEPSACDVTLEATGFRRKVVTGVTVRSGDQVTLEFPLEVGSAAEP